MICLSKNEQDLLAGFLAKTLDPARMAELDRHIRVMITAGELRTIDKIGLLAFLKGRGISINTLL